MVGFWCDQYYMGHHINSKQEQPAANVAAPVMLTYLWPRGRSKLRQVEIMLKYERKDVRININLISLTRIDPSAKLAFSSSNNTKVLDCYRNDLWLMKKVRKIIIITVSWCR